MALVDAGSSPRVRGTDGPSPDFFFGSRFIPACAGNSGGGAGYLTAPPVHPRVCGEQMASILCSSQRDGSSPRVRGTETARAEFLRSLRFIPACAGNRLSDLRSLIREPVHPRVCGEQAACAVAASALAGSSPRVRGTERIIACDAHDQRFIPACAGNRAVSRVAPFCRCGSSPRVRGTGRRSSSRAARRRFIPACAGNRREAAFLDVPVSVHPRVCGEQAVSRVAPFCRCGSSPRVRGTVRRGQCEYISFRFIPACAGNSPSLTSKFSV